MIWSKPELSKKGFTLIELIIFIVVGAIILPASFVAFTAAITAFFNTGLLRKGTVFCGTEDGRIDKLFVYQQLPVVKTDRYPGY